MVTHHYSVTNSCVLCAQMNYMNKKNKEQRNKKRITARDQTRLLTRHRFTCGICGDDFDYGGTTFEVGNKQLTPHAISWDRIDPKGDYSPDNLQPTHWLCNKMRGDMPIDKFKDWLKKCNTHMRL